jgi:hypothetical protein
MDKKVWLGFIAVAVTFLILDFIVNGLILASTYQELQDLWRPDMDSKMYLFYVIAIIVAFFFSLIYSRWRRGTGIGEGVHYGLLIGFLMSIPMAYGTYASIAIPYSLAIQWFIFGMIEYVIAGIVLALVFGKDESAAA